ncbi:hypothetical protein BJ742DRAFT_859946 [Cladochytrium replicatum]|nr:hypothetical protein BJ742DRAFT_859946 [Cladochytrium replicatum]
MIANYLVVALLAAGASAAPVADPNANANPGPAAAPAAAAAAAPAVKAGSAPRLTTQSAVDHCKVTYETHVAICKSQGYGYGYDTCKKQADSWLAICQAQTSGGYYTPPNTYYEPETEYYEPPAEEYYEHETEYYEPETEYYEAPSTYDGARARVRVKAPARAHGAYEPPKDTYYSKDYCEVTYKQHLAICEAQGSYSYGYDTCKKDAEAWVAICRAQTSGGSYYEPETEYYEPETEYYEAPSTYYGARARVRVKRPARAHRAYESPKDTYYSKDHCEVTYKQHLAICEAQGSYSYGYDTCKKDAEAWVAICRAQTSGGSYYEPETEYYEAPSTYYGARARVHDKAPARAHGAYEPPKDTYYSKDHCEVTYETYVANCGASYSYGYDSCFKQAKNWKAICEAQTSGSYYKQK